jgi:hypothetical protein
MRREQKGKLGEEGADAGVVAEGEAGGRWNGGQREPTGIVDDGEANPRRDVLLLPILTWEHPHHATPKKRRKKKTG